MKAKVKIFIILIALIFNSSLFLFEGVDASSNDLEINELDFSSFERAIIELNNLDKTTYSMRRTSQNDTVIESQTKDLYKLKRLIVHGKLKETYGAIDVISYDNLHILCYSSSSNTEYAYKQLQKDTSLNVIVDQQHKVDDYAMNDYSYDGYKNWAAEAVDIGGYRKYLSDNNVTKEVVVVVLDTGINTSHSMFKNRLLTDSNGKIKGFSYYNSTYRYSYNNLSFDLDDETTPNIDEEDRDKYSFEDDDGHGTHVAGIICDLTPENVKILPIKVGDEKGYSTTAIFISAYLRIINIYSNQYEIVSTNLSFSGAGKSSEDEKNTFNEKCYDPLIKLNILPITAAGNESQENNIEGLNAIVVSSLKQHDGEYVFDSSYSNYGKIVDIAAPGTSVMSAAISSYDGQSSNFVLSSGTSMASPQVAGIVALLYLDPNLPEDYDANYIETKLYENTLDMGEIGKDIYYGEGMLNIKYFQTEETASLTFFEDGVEVSSYINSKNFEEEFDLEIQCSKEGFEIIYTTNKKLPTFKDHIDYTSYINIKETITLYIMAIKIVEGKITERTDVYRLSYFNSSTPIELCFKVSDRSYLSEYTGNYTTLNIPEVMHGKKILGIEPSLFKNSNIESITLPSTLTTIAGYVFQNAKNLKYIYAPGVTKIYKAAFDNCTSLKMISDQHPTSNQTEGAYLPSLEETVSFAFSDNHSLESVRLSKLKTLADDGYDFYNCINLKEVYLPNITSIPTGTFMNCSNFSGGFHISENIQAIGRRAFYGTKISYFTIDKNNKYFYTDGIGLYDTSTFLSSAPNNDNFNYEILSEVVIKGRTYTITTIAESAMSNVTINSLTIPQSITTINRFAFDNTNINTLYYNAKKATHTGYFDEETYMRANVFNSIKTIELGANVEVVPQRLFQDVYFDTLIVNSYNTKFASASFYRMKEQGTLDKLILNFPDVINTTYYHNQLVESCIFTYSEVNYLYTKNKVNPSTLFYRLSNLIYESKDGEYFIYSKELVSNKYKIESSSNGFGQIDPQGNILLNKGESQKYTFSPNTGYYVYSIIVDGESLSDNELKNAIDNGYTFSNVSTNHTIQVLFKAYEYTITYKDDKGLTLSNLSPTKYQYGQTITLPTPQKGSKTFLGWYDNINYSGSPITKIYPYDYGDKVYYAKFDESRFTITVIQAQNGTISLPLNYYEEGSNAYFAITADEGYHIEYLIIDGIIYNSSSLNTYEFVNISKNHSISAKFSANTNTSYKVNHWQESLTSDGTIINGKYYNLFVTEISKTGETGALTNAKPYEYEGFEAQPINQKIILGNGNTIVDVLYNRKNYSLILNSDQGVRSLFGNGTYPYQAQITVEAEVINGYSFIGWISSNPQAVRNSNKINYTFKMPSENITLTATTTNNKYKVTIVQSDNGRINPSTEQLIEKGESLTLQIIPNKGYYLSKLLINDLDKTSSIIDGKYTIENIAQNYNVIATFKPRTDTGYTVRHWQESLTFNGAISFENKNYELFETDVSNIGTTGELTRATARNYEGFKAQNFVQKTILGDGSTIIDILYNRNSYLLNIIKDEGIEYVMGQGYYLYGELVELYAQEKQGYNWDSWLSFNHSIINNSFNKRYTFNMPCNDVTLTATATIKQYTIDVLPSNEGTILIEKGNIVNYNDSVELEIKANEGYALSNLYINGIDRFQYVVNNKYILSNIKENYLIEAKFSPEENMIYLVKHYQENLSKDEGTYISGKYYTLVATDTSKRGQTGTLTQAVANRYSGFTSQPITQKIILGDGSTVVEVLYNRNTYYVGLLKDAGVVSVIGSGDYLYGETVKINATIKNGYNWKQWKSSNEWIIEGSSTLEYTFTMPSDTIQFTALTTIKQYQVTILPTVNGLVITSDNKVVNHGGSLQLEFEPEEGYSLSKLLINDIDRASYVYGNKYFLENIVSDVRVEAIFDLSKYTIITKTNGNGTIKPSKEAFVSHGQNITFNIFPEIGYEINSILIDGFDIPQGDIENVKTNGYTFYNVTSNHSIEVIFEKIDFIIYLTIEGDGIISPSENVTVKYQEDKILYFQANEGSYIQDVIVDGISVGEVGEYKFENVVEDHQLKVIFKKETYKVEIEILGEGSFNSENDLENVEYDSSVSVSIIVEEGYKISQVWVNKKLVNIKNNILEIANIKEDVKVTVTIEEGSVVDSTIDSVEVQVKGISCAKHKNENSSGLFDFLFILLVTLGIAFPKKRFFK